MPSVSNTAASLLSFPHQDRSLKGRIKVTGPNNADMGYVAADLSNKVGLQLFRPGACAADALVVAFNIADALQSKTKPMDLYILVASFFQGVCLY